MLELNIYTTQTAHEDAQEVYTCTVSGEQDLNGKYSATALTPTASPLYREEEASDPSYIDLAADTLQELIGLVFYYAVETLDHAEDGEYQAEVYAANGHSTAHTADPETLMDFIDAECDSIMVEFHDITTAITR